MRDFLVMVDDDPAVLDSLQQCFDTNEFQIKRLENLANIEEKLASWNADVLLLDIHFPADDRGGLNLLPRLRSLFPELSILMISGNNFTENILESGWHGVRRFLVKGEFKADELRTAVQECLDERGENIREQIEGAGQMIGTSLVMRNLVARIKQFAPLSEACLLQGESGSGKELAARLLHKHNPQRSKAPFMAINCAAIPTDLFESCLFGHVQGALAVTPGQLA